MNNIKLLAIKAAIYDMGLKFNQEPSDAKITAYAKELLDYTPEQINFAFKQVILSGSAFFPSLAEVLKHLRHTQEKPEDKAPLIATEIINFVRMHHRGVEKNYYHNLSIEAVFVLSHMGGTQDIRDSENFETMRAQLERLSRGVLNQISSSSKKQDLKKIGISENVLSFPKSEMKGIDFSNFTNSTEDKWEN